MDQQPIADTTPKTPVREIDSKEVLQGETEVWIRHHGEIYRLRLTKNGKLILQK